MDSVSQLALGAAIGEFTLGRRIGRAAMVLGAALGTLPDLDVLVGHGDAVASFTYHRSWSHSILTLSLLSLFLAGLLQRFYPKKWVHEAQTNDTSQKALGYTEWLVCVWLVLITHSLLDGLTVYGTQLLWPLPVLPVAWGSMFIIDPLYTLPLVAGVWVAWRCRRKSKTAVSYALAISSLYIALSLFSQQHARKIALQSLGEQSLSIKNVLLAPAPFSILWRIVAMDDTQYHEGFYSILDRKKTIHFNTYPSNRSLIDNNLDHWPIARLDWFTRGMLSAQRRDNQLIINDLRMGVESSYVFRFDVGGLSGADMIPGGVSTLLPMEFDSDRIKAILRRAWDQSSQVPAAY